MSEAASPMQGHTGQHFVLLRAGALTLLIPHTEVGAAEYVPEGLEHDATTRRALYPQRKTAGEFLALDESLQLMPSWNPQARYLCTTLRATGTKLHWCWSDVRILHGHVIRAHSLPPVMQAPHLPVKAYAVLQGKMCFVTTAQALTQYALAQQDADISASEAH